MAKFKIKGVEYDLKAGLQKATLQDLYVLKVRQKLGMKTLAAVAERMAQAEGALDILEDEAQLQAFMAIIWLTRRHAGEHISFEEATSDFGLDDMAFENDPEDEEPGAPKDVPTGSGPDAGPPPEAAPATT